MIYGITSISVYLLYKELGTILEKCIIDTITITHFFLIIYTTTITLKKIIVDIYYDFFVFMYIQLQIHHFLSRYILVDTNTL